MTESAPKRWTFFKRQLIGGECREGGPRFPPHSRPIGALLDSRPLNISQKHCVFLLFEHSQQQFEFRIFQNISFYLSKTTPFHLWNLLLSSFLCFSRCFVFFPLLENRRNHAYVRPNHDRGVAQDRQIQKNKFFNKFVT